MPTSKLTPLQFNVPIVNSDGTPSPYFIQLLQTWKEENFGVAVSVEELAGLIITAGAGLTGGGDLGSGDFSLDVGEGSGIDVGPDLISANVQEILNQISTTRGTILYRGAALWSALAPGTAGHFLKTNGPGADPEWAAAAGGGGGALAFVGEAIAVGGEAILTVGSIPNTYKDLVFSIVHIGSAATQEIKIRFNGDASAIYNTGRHFGGTAAGSDTVANQTSFPSMGSHNVGGSTAPNMAALSGEILDYASTAHWKHMLAQIYQPNGDAAGYVLNTSSIWKSTAAVNSVSIFPNSGTWNAGTKLRIWAR